MLKWLPTWCLEAWNQALAFSSKLSVHAVNALWNKTEWWHCSICNQNKWPMLLLALSFLFFSFWRQTVCPSSFVFVLDRPDSSCAFPASFWIDQWENNSHCLNTSKTVLRQWLLSQYCWDNSQYWWWHQYKDCKMSTSAMMEPAESMEMTWGDVWRLGKTWGANIFAH